jgi:hypothetical protein
MIPVGTAAGIGAIFNTPITGVVFALAGGGHRERDGEAHLGHEPRGAAPGAGRHCRGKIRAIPSRATTSATS